MLLVFENWVSERDVDKGRLVKLRGRAREACRW